MDAIAIHLPVKGGIKRTSIKDIKEEADGSKSTGEPVIRNLPETPKLFALTLEVDVGDEVIALENFGGMRHGDIGNVEEIDDYGITVRFGPVKKYKMLKGCFGKSLGSLSPNATWVKEGEEIEVSVMPFARYGDSKQWRKPMGGLPSKEEKSFMGVKCPTCNTYH